MTKSQLIEALAKAEGITLKAAETAVNVTFQSMELALIRSDRLEIRGFGSFKVKYYEGYKGRNPKTGELIEVQFKKLPFFKVGKELRERVNGGDEAEKVEIPATADPYLSRRNRKYKLIAMIRTATPKNSMSFEIGMASPAGGIRV